MLTLPGSYIGDAWFHVHDDTTHCLFLTSPETCPISERPYAGQLVLWGGEWLYMGTGDLSRHGHGSDYIANPYHVVADASGLHASI